MATFAEPGASSISAEEAKSDVDGPLPLKRKPELTSVDKDNIDEVDDDMNKKQKHDIPPVGKNDFVPPDIEKSKDINEAGNSGIQLNNGVDEGAEDEDDDDEEDYEDDEVDDDDSDEDAESSGDDQVIDPKGKGILKDEKGKGKLIDESEDSSHFGTESDSDSDLSDDPLAEVDLHNILPSRTRRRTAQQGIHISSRENTDDDGNS